MQPRPSGVEETGMVPSPDISGPLVAGLVDLDATYFIQLGVFLLLYLLLSQVFFRPYVARLRRRAASTHGLRQQAQEQERTAREILQRIEDRMAEVRQAAVAERKALAEEGARLRDAMIAREKERLQQQVDREMAEMRSFQARLLQEVDRKALELAEEMERQVRSVEAP